MIPELQTPNFELRTPNGALDLMPCCLFPLRAFSGEAHEKAMNQRNRTRIVSLLTILRCTAGFGAQSFPDASQLPVQSGLPDPLLMLDGRRVTNREEWTNQ